VLPGAFFQLPVYFLFIVGIFLADLKMLVLYLYFVYECLNCGRMIFQ